MQTTTKLFESEKSLKSTQFISLNDLFTKGIRQIKDVEEKLINVLPKVLERTGTEDLRIIIENHLSESRFHVERLAQIFTYLGIEKGETTNIIDEYISELKDILNNTIDIATRDMGIICVLQKIEHYEIASYENLIVIAKVLRYKDIVNLLKTTLDEEEETEERFSVLAEACIAFDVEDNYFAYND